MKFYRLKLGISQSKLAEKMDTATNYIAAIEAGRRFPSVDMLENMAIALEIDTIDLFSAEPVQTEKMNKFQEEILIDIEKFVSKLVLDKLNSLKNIKKARNKKELDFLKLHKRCSVQN
jgi:transcriptional regulator with XRE-family HTH domain